MVNEGTKYSGKISKPTLHRLPWYLAHIRLLKGKGYTVVSPMQITKEIAIYASRVSKDLSFVNISGKTLGYEINALIKILESFLGFTAQHKAFLFGMERLSAALMRTSQLCSTE